MPELKTITVESSVVKALDTLWIEYNKWKTAYKVDWYDARPYLIWFVVWVFIASIIADVLVCH